jgi:hypothetical protein
LDYLDRIIYETDTGILWFDQDGSGTHYQREAFAVLVANLNIGAGDFIVS